MGKAVGIKIEAMKKEDIDQVLVIEHSSFSMPWSKNLFLSEFRSPGVSTLLVALGDAPVRTVSAFIIYWIVADEMHILNLAVDPEQRRQGIAKTLVLSALRRAFEKGAKRAFLEVRASNIPAYKLYLGLGFSGTSVRREYYDMPVEDAIVMTLETGALASLMRSGACL
ncbi:MAG TPA: ribosomal protein S18-alanine N-acetyltransferase [Nitrospirota bacterium]|nr:ribosomal protein S18-alanine N-acetyltransferase [Nitrospirota bacterium]